jgi:hypothetical protein
MEIDIQPPQRSLPVRVLRKLGELAGIVMPNAAEITIKRNQHVRVTDEYDAD